MTERGGKNLKFALAKQRRETKKKPLHDKIFDGNPGKRLLTVIEFKDTADLTGQECRLRVNTSAGTEQKSCKKTLANVE
jgi:hypothetical protein